MNKQLLVVLTCSALTLTPALAAPKKMSKPESPVAEEKAAKPKPAAVKITTEQAQARQAVTKLDPEQKSRMLSLLNEGSTEDLSVIKGISKTRATAIAKARPFTSVDQVVLVRGIGKTTFGNMITFAQTPPTPEKSKAKIKPKEKSKAIAQG